LDKTIDPHWYPYDQHPTTCAVIALVQRSNKSVVIVGFL